MFVLSPLSQTAATDNFECVDATPLAVNGDTVTGNINDATLTASPCRSQEQKAAWFIFSGTGNIMTVSTCHSGTDYNSEIGVQTACSTDDATCISNEPNTGVAVAESIASCAANPFGKTLTFTSDTDTTYYLSVTGVGDLSGTYEVSVVDHPSPKGDICADAHSVTVNGDPWLGTTVNATVGPICTNRFSGPTQRRGVWAIVRGTGNIMSLSTCHPRTNFQTFMLVYSGCLTACGSQNGGTNGVEVPFCESALATQILVQSTLDTLYYVFLSGDGVGDFGLTVTDFARPANDACEDAIPILVNGDRIAGTTVNATINGYCPDRFSIPQARGVWYRTIGTGNIVTFSTCHPETTYGTSIRVSVGSCGGTCPGNVDTGVDIVPCDNEFGSTLTFQTTQDTVYYIFVFSTITANTGNFTLSVVDYQRPPNDVCVEPIPLEVNGAVLFGSTVNSTTDSFCPARFSVSTGRGVWYTAVGNGNIMTFSTCFDETDFDSRITINSGSCGTACIADQDPGSAISACTLPLGREVTIESVDGTQYYVYVRSSGTDVVGNFGISLIDYTPPTNNVCENAAILAVDDRPLIASTRNATLSTSCASAAARGTFYRLLGTGNKLSVSTCFAATAFEANIEVRAGGCASDCTVLTTERLCAENSFGQVVSFDSNDGEEYVVHIFGNGIADTGTFALQVRDNTTTLAPTTARPSTSPTTSPQPSISPSTSPSISPSTAAPSFLPTTTEPSLAPTTEAPTDAPTNTPSESPFDSFLPTPELDEEDIEGRDNNSTESPTSPDDTPEPSSAATPRLAAGVVALWWTIEVAGML